jgi:hypothetical protein
MRKIQITNNNDFLIKKNYTSFYINLKEKNIISYIGINFHKSNNTILVAQNIYGYFLYYASSILKNTNIVINPLFFDSNGNKVSPSTKIYNKDNINKCIVILTDNFEYFDKTIKFIKDNGNKYFIIKEHELLKTLTQIENELTQVEKKPKRKISGMTKEILKKIK